MKGRSPLQEEEPGAPAQDRHGRPPPAGAGAVRVAGRVGLPPQPRPPRPAAGGKVRVFHEHGPGMDGGISELTLERLCSGCSRMITKLRLFHT